MGNGPKFLLLYVSKKKYFETLRLKQGEVVLLGDNKAYKVYAVGTLRLKMFDHRGLFFIA